MSLTIDHDLLVRFEEKLNPADIASSPVKARLVGYGEISAIFVLEGNESVVFKRLPIFDTVEEAKRYIENFNIYCGHLSDAGLRLPEQETDIVELPGRPVSLYIAQSAFPDERICNRKLLSLGKNEGVDLVLSVAREIKRVWEYNDSKKGEIELSLDGQISNWACSNKEESFSYLDTSTPLYRVGGIEQFNPEPLLQSSPPGLRWILKQFFLDDVMNRYYSFEAVITDLIANLYKEQKPDLIPPVVEAITSEYEELKGKISLKSVESYYREDKLIWTLFLSFRRIDRFLKTRVFGKRYEFILPGKIKR